MSEKKRTKSLRAQMRDNARARWEKTNAEDRAQFARQIVASFWSGKSPEERSAIMRERARKRRDKANLTSPPALERKKALETGREDAEKF